MKLWPFSKKSAPEGILDRTMDLPPGVVLASPDEPPPATLPVINSASPPTTVGPLIDPALGIDQNTPEIEQILGPMPLGSPAGDPGSTVQSPMSTLPEDLPDALFSDSAPALWLPPTPETDMISPIESETETSALESLAPPDSMMEMLPPPSIDSSFSTPSAQAATTPLADPSTVQEMASSLPETQVNVLSDAAMLAPPPLPADDLAPPITEISSSLSTESTYFQPEGIYTPEAETFTPDPIAMEGAGASFDMQDFPPPDLDDTASFLPPTMDDTGGFDYIPPDDQPSDDSLNIQNLNEQQTASEVLAELMAKTETMHSHETPGVEPASAYESSTEQDSVFESANDDSFFASASFDAMDGFGQVNGNASLFSPDDSMQATDQDDFYLPPDAELESMQTNTFNPADAEQSYMSQETYASEEYPIGEYSEGSEYVSDESVLLDALEAGSNEYTMDDMAMVEEVDELDDITSYDMGHYDDPEAPSEAFVLGSDEPEPILSLDLETGAVPNEEAVDILSSQSAMYYPQETLAEELVSALSSEEPSLPPEQPMPARLPEPNPMADALTALSNPEPPKPMPSQAIPPRANPIQQESTFRKPSSPTPYSDSIADALQSFEQEVLLRDTRFLKQSINNLVERYFAQSEPENEW